MGKMKRTPKHAFNKRARELALMRNPGVTWSLDMVGPFQKSIFGYIYSYTLISDKLKIMRNYNAKSKGTFRDVAAWILTDIKDILNRSNVKEMHINLTEQCYSIRSDSAKEFLSDKNQTEFTEQGVRFTFSAPYTPTSNPYIERAHLTVLGSMYCLLFHERAPVTMWCMALDLAVLIYNLMPHSALPDRKSPEEYSTGVLQDFDFLNVFWNRAAIRIPKNQRGKLQPRVQIGR
ncbi:MAG: hypothetical protein COB29_01260 [Sulfitobacter sp.]|nr:MAG: hypothetical protein COB29_01260 [Sulfitobacter sp.]